MKRIALAFFWLNAGGLLIGEACGNDWPTYRGDNRRSGVTTEKPEFPLALQWERRTSVPPAPAWTGPAPWDAFSGNKGLQPQRDFDSAFYTTHADGIVYFGSSVDNCVHALDAASGESQWVFFTEGAVRLPPTIHDGRAFFGSDDGNVYSVNAKNGSLAWHLRGGPSDTRVPSDGKILSLWPCRTGVLIEDSQAFCAFSLVPWKESLLYSLNPNDGSVTYRIETESNTFQGPLAMAKQLVLMQGKAPPIAFDAAKGSGAISYGLASGVRCTLTDAGHLIVGPNNQKHAEDLVIVVDCNSGKKLASFSGADRLLVDGATGYVHRNGQLAAFDFARHVELSVEQTKLTEQQSALKKNNKESANDEQLAEISRELTQLRDSLAATVAWELALDSPCDLIKAGTILFVGTRGVVTAIDTRSGESVWTAEIQGRACGLTFADGRLFVSSDLGHIYGFGPVSSGE